MAAWVDVHRLRDERVTGRALTDHVLGRVGGVHGRGRQCRERDEPVDKSHDATVDFDRLLTNSW